MLPRLLGTGSQNLLFKHAPYHHAPEHRPADEDAVADEVDDRVTDVDKAHGGATRSRRA